MTSAEIWLSIAWFSMGIVWTLIYQAVLEIIVDHKKDKADN